MVPRTLDSVITTAIEDPNIDKKPIVGEQPWLFD